MIVKLFGSVTGFKAIVKLFDFVTVYKEIVKLFGSQKFHLSIICYKTCIRKLFLGFNGKKSESRC